MPLPCTLLVPPPRTFLAVFFSTPPRVADFRISAVAPHDAARIFPTRHHHAAFFLLQAAMPPDGQFDAMDVRCRPESLGDDARVFAAVVGARARAGMAQVTPRYLASIDSSPRRSRFSRDGRYSRLSRLLQAHIADKRRLMLSTDAETRMIFRQPPRIVAPPSCSLNAR